MRFGWQGLQVYLVLYYLTVLEVDKMNLRLVDLTQNGVSRIFEQYFELLVVALMQSIVDNLDQPLHFANTCIRQSASNRQRHSSCYLISTRAYEFLIHLAMHVDAKLNNLRFFTLWMTF